jgi:two-component system, OmpR family, sensor kinase
MPSNAVQADQVGAREAALQAELAALRAEMQDFTYTVSHDLRASLRHVVSYLHLVEEDAGPQLTPEVRGFLQTAVDSAVHMRTLMDGLLEYSRVGTVPLQCARLSVASALSEAITELQQVVAPDRAIDWQWNPAAPAASAAEVWADPALLKLCLGHLLGNAVKFTAQRSPVHIVVDVQPAPDGLWQIGIQDNGAGFNPAQAGQLFRPFQRLHSVRQFPGIGMGLALSRKIASRLGGQLTVSAQPEQGCKVLLSLPVAPV